MKNEIVVFGHNDLDFLGCMSNIEFKFPTLEKKYFHTNYQDIDEKVDLILEYCRDHGHDRILIADVSFSDNKDALRKLYNEVKVTIIDHHLYADGFWDEFPEMKVVWDKTKCAAKLCHEYFSNQGKNSHLDMLTYLTDVYDIWQTKSQHFGLSQDLNNYFWTRDIGDLNKELVKNDFKLPSDYREVVQGIKKTDEEGVAALDAQNLIHRSGEITVAFVNEFFNQILIKEMQEGKNFVIGVNSWGIIRVRIREEAPITSAQKDSLRLTLTGTSNIGHMNAFTYRPENFGKTVTPDELFREVARVVSAIQIAVKFK